LIAAIGFAPFDRKLMRLAVFFGWDGSGSK
jgi:hypothetical protein